MEYKEIAIIVLILLIYFLGRNVNGNTSEEEQKIAGSLGAAIMYPVIGVFFLALIFGVLSSPFFWALFIPYIILKIKDEI